MPRCLIVYFSLRGTTARVAEQIGLGLQAAGYTVEAFNLKDGSPPNPAGYDLLGVGTPVYAYSLPFNVADYLAQLPTISGRPAFSFVLYGTYHFEATDYLRRALVSKGTREVGQFTCHGCGIYLGYQQRGYLFSPEHPTAEDLERAEAFGRQVARHVAGEPYAPPLKQPTAPVVYRVERFACSRPMARYFHSYFFRVDKKKCSKCSACRKGCPVHNIRADAEGFPVWGRDCMLCLMCEMFCPREAITSAIDWPIFGPFFDYNVRVAAADPGLSHIQVRLSRGRVVKIEAGDPQVNTDRHR